MKIVTITGNEDRHQFFRKFINRQQKINVVFSVIENLKNSQTSKILKNKKNLRYRHFLERRKEERLFFKRYLKDLKDVKNKIIINKGALNDDKKLIDKIIRLKPDIIFSYGCSLIKNQLIKKYKRKFINLHLGLSPYYRGSGTNYWPLVNKEPHFLGATFMFIDEGVDTGETIFQFRPKINLNDNIHTIGNRIIFEAANYFPKIIRNLRKHKKKKTFYNSKVRKYYKNKDFSEISVKKLKQNFKKSMLLNYLNNKTKIDKTFKINDLLIKYF